MKKVLSPIKLSFYIYLNPFVVSIFRSKAKKNVSNHVLIMLFAFLSQNTFAIPWTHFARNIFKRTAFAHPTTAAYLYAMRTYERRLDDGTVQQLHVGSDEHKAIAAEKQQMQDFVQHIKQQGVENCFVATENHPDTNNGYGEFLKKTPHSVVQENIPHVNLEFRLISNPGTSQDPNTATVQQMFSAFEQYAEKFKDKAIAQGMLTEKDFEPLVQLKKRLAPHLDKTVYELWKENGYDDSRKSWQAPRTKHGSILDDIRKTESKLIEDAALYQTCSSRKQNVYLNMGGWHIERNQSPKSAYSASIDTRLAQKGWFLTGRSGVNTEFAGKNVQPVDLAPYFASLSPRGSTLPKPMGAMCRFVSRFVRAA